MDTVLDEDIYVFIDEDIPIAGPPTNLESIESKQPNKSRLTTSG